MQLKLFVFLLALFILVACSTTKVIKLSAADGASKEFGYGYGRVKTTNNDSSYATYARKLGLDSFVLVRFNHYPTSYRVPTSRVAIYAKDHNEHLIRYVSGTPQEIPIKDFDTEILFLYGKKAYGTYIVVADQNNNKSFTDDSVFVVNEPQENYFAAGTKRLGGYPHVTIDNLKSYYNGEVRPFSLNLILEPRLFKFDEDSARRLSLGIISIDYVTGAFKFNGKKYKVAARNALLPQLYFDPQLVMIKFAEVHDTAAFQKTKGEMRTHFVGDTVQLRKHQFVIKEVSPLLDKITIQRLRKTKE